MIRISLGKCSKDCADDMTDAPLPPCCVRYQHKTKWKLLAYLLLFSIIIVIGTTNDFGKLINVVVFISSVVVMGCVAIPFSGMCLHPSWRCSQCLRGRPSTSDEDVSKHFTSTFMMVHIYLWPVQKLATVMHKIHIPRFINILISGLLVIGILYVLPVVVAVAVADLLGLPDTTFGIVALAWIVVSWRMILRHGLFMQWCPLCKDSGDDDDDDDLIPDSDPDSEQIKSPDGIMIDMATSFVDDVEKEANKRDEKNND